MEWILIVVFFLGAVLTVGRFVRAASPKDDDDEDGPPIVDLLP